MSSAAPAPSPSELRPTIPTPVATETPRPLELSRPRNETFALLGGLKAGDPLGDAVVVSVGPIRRGRLPLEVSVGGSTGTLELSLRDDVGPEPIAVTERYAVYWRTAGPGTNHLMAATLEEVAVDLGRVVAAHERTAPVPEGLTKFTEEKRAVPSGQQLL